MRFELSGIISRVDPQVIIFESNDTFDTAAYRDLGYTTLDVICIGGGGGRGGGVDTANTGTLIRTYGGEGGGGGFHRVQGLLSELPDSCPIVVGAAGAAGTEQANPTNVGLTTDGGDGHYSSFNTDFCQASGGKGGKRAQTVSTTVNPLADGGEGGIGNRTAVGGGGLGGHCGDPDDDPSTSTDGEDGTIIDDIGHGGGGGAGAITKYDGTSYLEATGGGHGSWLPDNQLVAGDAEDAQVGGTGVDSSKPGRGGGATARPLTGLPYNYGQAGVPGAVVVYLAAG
jgi:hypothetical protein